MSVLYCDEIKIKSISIDENGVKNVTISDAKKVHVREYNKYITDVNGNEVMADMLVSMDQDGALDYKDKIAIIKKSGKDFLQPNKFFLVRKIIDVNGFTIHHREVYLKDGS